MRCALLCGAAVAMVSSAASADVVITLTNFTANAFQFSQAVAPGAVTGTLTGVSVSATLLSSSAFTYADDLCVYVDVLPLSLNGLVQVGGFSDLGAQQRYLWPSGSSDAIGTVVLGEVSFASGIDMSIPNLAVWIGNGYGATGASGTWSGTITLHGVNAIPAPGAIALLALAGFVSRRRR